MLLNEQYEIVVGLEVHMQMLTKSKAFASDEAGFGAMPNTLISPVTLGHPGTLPMFNEKVVEFAVRLGLACGCIAATKPSPLANLRAPCGFAVDGASGWHTLTVLGTRCRSPSRRFRQCRTRFSLRSGGGFLLG